MVKLDRLTKDGADIKRLQRQFGLARPQITFDELDAIETGVYLAVGLLRTRTNSNMPKFEFEFELVRSVSRTLRTL